MTIIEACILCSLCYRSELDIKTFLKRNKYTHVSYLGTAFICYKNKETVIVCKGSTVTSVANAITNINSWPSKSSLEHGYLHSGFLRSANTVYNNILFIINTINTLNCGNIICIGHSSGGAVATILANRLDAEAIYSFGSPRVGTNKFVEQLTSKKIKHYRLVNNNDFITNLPFRFLGYRHYKKPYYLDFYGNVKKATLFQRITDIFRGSSRSIQKRELYSGIFDHSINLYYKKLIN